MPCDVSPLPADLWDELCDAAPREKLEAWTSAVHRRAKALGQAEGEQAVLKGLKTVAGLNGSGSRVIELMRDGGDEDEGDEPGTVEKASATWVESEHPRDKTGIWIPKGDVDHAAREAAKGNHEPANKLRAIVHEEDKAALEEHLASPGRADPTAATGKVRSQRAIGEDHGETVAAWLHAVTAAIRHGADYDHHEIQRAIERAVAGQVPKLRRVLRALDPDTKVSDQPAHKEGLQRRIREIISTAVHAAKDDHGHKQRAEREQREAELQRHEQAHALTLHDSRERLHRFESWHRAAPNDAQASAAVAAAREEVARQLGVEKAFPVLKAKFASTQIQLPPEMAAALQALGRQIPDDDLGEDGREDEPHVTVKYGLHDDDPAAVRAALIGRGPVRFRLGAVTVFEGAEGGKPYDVVKVDVESDDLHKLNAVLCELPHTDTWPEYHPHATIAYVNAGKGKEYAARFGSLGMTGTVDEVVFSDTKKKRTAIPLSPVTVKAFGVGEELVLKAIHHAPAGGCSLNGKDYAGGQFIPDEEVEAATPEERANVNRHEHTVVLPKDPKRLQTGQMVKALDEMGYKLGAGKFDLKTKSQTWQVQQPDGSTGTLSSEQIRELIYRGAADRRKSGEPPPGKPDGEPAPDQQSPAKEGAETPALSDRAESFRKLAWHNGGGGKKKGADLPPAALAKLVRSYAAQVLAAERAGEHGVALELIVAAPGLLPGAKTFGEPGGTEPYSGSRHEGVLAGHSGSVRVTRPGLTFPYKGMGGKSQPGVVIRARAEAV